MESDSCWLARPLIACLTIRPPPSSLKVLGNRIVPRRRRRGWLQVTSQSAFMPNVSSLPSHPADEIAYSIALAKESISMGGGACVITGHRHVRCVHGRYKTLSRSTSNLQHGTIQITFFFSDQCNLLDDGTRDHDCDAVGPVQQCNYHLRARGMYSIYVLARLAGVWTLASITP
jgi:hypothetical protein